MTRVFISVLFIVFFLYSQTAGAQKTVTDSTGKPVVEKNKGVFSKNDPAKAYNPRIATYRSAILPGWGQVTNKKYWKVPIVYAALGITTYIFFDNIKTYNDARRAYANAIDGDQTNNYLVPQPYFTIIDQPERIKTFRNQVRQNIDYTVLFFIIFWGLNVVDATVDAHLKTFDVSDDLSLQVKPGYSQLAGTSGISLVLNIGRNHSK